RAGVRVPRLARVELRGGRDAQRQRRARRALDGRAGVAPTIWIMHDQPPLPTQRLVSVAELEPILDGIGTPVATRLLSGGTFSAVQGVDLADGRRVVAKVAVPDGALPDG